MLRSTGLLHVPEEAPLVELLKELADELDTGGGVKTRAAYLSALKDLRRVLNASGRPKGSAESVLPTVAAEPTEPDEELPLPNSLAAFKAKRGIAS